MDTFTRILWVLLAALIAAAGTLVALASVGHLPGTRQDAPLLWSGLLRRWREAGAVAPWSLAALGVAAALAGVLLIHAVLRPRGSRSIPDLKLDQNGTPGRTRVSSAALSAGLEQDLTSLPQVRRARVGLLGGPDRLNLRVRLQVHPGVDLDALGEAVQSRITRFTATTDLEPQTLAVVLALDGRSPARVQ